MGRPPKKTEAEREASRQRIRERLRAPKAKRSLRPTTSLLAPETLDIAELRRHLNREYLPPQPRKWMFLLIEEIKRLRSENAKLRKKTTRLLSREKGQTDGK